MLNRKTLFGTVSAVALALPFASALAAAPMGFAGNLTGEYAYIDPNCTGCGTGNLWGIGGSGAFGLGMNNLAGEVDGGYANISGSGVSTDIWNIGGSLFWASAQGRLGGNVNYTDVSTGSSNVTAYGGFGEFYPGDQVTIGVRGGGFSATGSNGYYLGGLFTAYVMPNFGITGGIDYMDLSATGAPSITQYVVKGEYMFSTMTPVSISGGYLGTDLSCTGCGTTSAFFVSLTLYTSGNGNTLMDKQRNGTVGTIASPNMLGFAF